MQEYLQRLREMEEEARAGLDRQAELYASIRAKRLRAEAIVGRPSNGDNGTGNGNGNNRHRHNVIVGPWAAVVGAAVAGSKALFGNARRLAATTSAAAVIAGGMALAVTETPHRPPTDDALPARPPAAAAPPGAHATPRPGPSRHPKPPAPPATPTPTHRPALPRLHVTATPHHPPTLPLPRPPAVGRPTAPPDDSSSGIGHPRRDCRLRLPRLLHCGLLRGLLAE